MSIIATEGGSKTKDFERPEAGTYVGRCIHVIDLGTHDKTWQGKTTKKHQVMLVWELSEQMEDGRPFVVNWKGTLSLNENATLRKYLEGWRGKKFTPDELKGFDLKNVLDKSCLLTLIESEWQGKTYVNVDNVTALMKGQTPDERVNDLVFYSIDDKESGDFNGMWEWQQKIVKDSDEWKAYDEDSAPFERADDETGDDVEESAPF